MTEDGGGDLDRSTPDSTSFTPPSEPLPQPVRSQVISWASDALDRLPAEQLPASLKRVASFAPSRRARLAGNQIAASLETDERFRAAVATDLRLRMGDLVQALESGTLPGAADPAAVAGVAYLVRPDGWQEVMGTALAASEADHASSARAEAHAQLDQARRQLADAQDELRRLREDSRDRLAEMKAENAELRRKLGDTRAQLKEARTAMEEAAERARASELAATNAASTGEVEVRKLRQRLEEVERQLNDARTLDRVERTQGTVRARLLLDTLLDAAQGLRRELALPTVEGAPADTVAAHVAEEGSRTSTGHRSLRTDDPALLEELLALPRVHLVVDGYNVTKTAWPDTSLESQRDRLVTGLAGLAGRSRAEVTVVFDAADKRERPLVNRPRGVRVLFSPVGVIADDVIRQLVAAEPTGRPVVVVSTDRALTGDVLRTGAWAVDSTALARLLGRS